MMPASTLSLSIPGYDITRRIHNGAQGVVYEATQRATRRKVAIKVISDGSLASPKARARFQREIQVLAQLRHPNIVTIHDSGTELGAFFYVMDFIHGVRLDEYLAALKLPIGDLLKLISRICDAVATTHRHGIIHRDLKPGNILVDSRGEPHVVDFGLAKPILDEGLIPPGEAGKSDDAPAGRVESSGAVPSARFVSTTGEFLGSVPWSSPEQVAGDPSRIDMRTDVYSLGVVLYQMLTGRFPYAVGGPLREAMNNIAQAEPVPPRSIRPKIDSDVETIVLKALSKDPGRRYQSAGELGLDINHFLAGEPIAAKRDSTLYVLRKRMSRHRGGLAAIAALVFLTVGFGASIISIKRQSQAAERIAGEIQLAFMDRALSMVDPGNPAVPSAEPLETIAARVEAELAAFPTIQCRLMERMGNVYRRLGLFDAALPYLRKSLEIRRRDPSEKREELASSLHSLAGLEWDLGQYSAAESHFREALSIRREVYGDGHPQVAESMNHLAACLLHQGDFSGAEELYRQTLNLHVRLHGEPHPETAGLYSNLGTCLMETGQYAEAEQHFRRALGGLAGLSGEDVLQGLERPQYFARVQTSLGACLVELGKLDEAEPLLRESLTAKRALLRHNHPSIALSLHWLARLSLDRGDRAVAETLAREALAVRVATLPDRHPYIAISLAMLGVIMLEQNRNEEAGLLLAEAYAIQREVLPRDHWRLAVTGVALGACFTDADRHEEAESLLLENFAILESARGEQDRYTQKAIEHLIALYEAQGNSQMAHQYRGSLVQNRK